MIYLKTPMDNFPKIEHLLYIKFFNLKEPRIWFKIRSFNVSPQHLIVCGPAIDVELLQRKQNQLVYSLQVADPQTYQIEQEFLSYKYITSITNLGNGDFSITFQ